MHLTEKQLAVQEKILLAVHEWRTIEEAKDKEFYSMPWCKVVRRKNLYTTVLCTVVRPRYNMLYSYILPYNSSNYSPIRIAKKDIEYIIWLPPTLPRVLNALWDYYLDLLNNWKNISRVYVTIEEEDRREYFDRKLLNSDWSDCCIWEQSEETQNKVAELLWVTF